MKKIIILLLSCFLSNLIHAAPPFPSYATINYNLSQIDEGDDCPSLLTNALVTITYEYDFKNNMGLAFIKQLQAARWTEPLYPLGISGVYYFMSNMSPTSVSLNGGKVVVYRVLFNLEWNGDSQVRLMLGEHGNCIMSTNIVNILQRA